MLFPALRRVLSLRQRKGEKFVERGRNLGRVGRKKYRRIQSMMAKTSQCPFCHIADGRTKGRTAAILYQDDRVVAFEDRSPQAFRHYLVIPVAHIKNVKTLTKSKEDYALVVQMQKVGQSLLEKSAPNSHQRFGFHKPPLNSVDHLHLHCLALPYKSWWRSVKYTSLGFLGAWISAETVLQRLNPVDTKVPT